MIDELNLTLDENNAPQTLDRKKCRNWVEMSERRVNVCIGGVSGEGLSAARTYRPEAPKGIFISIPNEFWKSNRCGFCGGNPCKCQSWDSKISTETPE